MDLPPVWLAFFAALAWALSWIGPLYSFGPRPVTAGLCIVAGVVLIGWSISLFVGRATPMEPRKTPSALLSTGPYRVNRNPVYTGLALLLLAFGLWLGALSAALMAGAFVIVIDRRFVRGEEAALRKAFGPAAEAYLARTRRW
jgi:protein-S-isoprenylcysteine O-methyltransferase Ste14